jgi:hypothetical protein
MKRQILNPWNGDVLSQNQGKKELQKVKCITSKKEMEKQTKVDVFHILKL